jgi:hypothetical protein
MKFHRERLPKPETMDIETFTEIELETVRLFVSNLCKHPARMRQFVSLVEQEMGRTDFEKYIAEKKGERRLTSIVGT